MTKNAFLSALEKELRTLPPEERNDAMQYYKEYFEEAGPEQEEKAARSLGSPKAIAADLLAASPALCAAAAYRRHCCRCVLARFSRFCAGRLRCRPSFNRRLYGRSIHICDDVQCRIRHHPAWRRPAYIGARRH